MPGLNQLPPLKGLLDILYPIRCQACDRMAFGFRSDTGAWPAPLAGRYLCPACTAEVAPVASPLCPTCGVLFLDAAGGDHLCGNCMETPPYYDRARAAGLYTGPLMEVIHRYKYLGKTGLARPLGRMLFDLFEDLELSNQVDRILPVPLHKKRLHSRGFNQAWLLIRQWENRYRKRYGRQPDWRADNRSLVRPLRTRSQVGLDRETRKKNLKKAFQVVCPERIRGSRILLVDDVLTTGATADACARVLKQSGAAGVVVLTLARTL